MTPRRLFHPNLPVEGGRVTLDSGASRHARVLRLHESDSVVLFDGNGNEAHALVTRIGETFECRVDAPTRAVGRARPRVTLVQAMPKGTKIDDIVRMCTELDVHRIVLATSLRTIGEASHHRLDRLKKIAQEAARQCGRADVPAILAPRPLLEVASAAPADTFRVVCWEESRKPMEYLDASSTKDAWLVVGAEGGMAPEEIEALRSFGFQDCSIGQRVLRVQTAAPVALALLQNYLERNVN